MVDLNAVNQGFSKKAEIYDAYCDAHPVIRWARSVIRSEVLRCVPSAGSVLELNAGTGSDALFFVEHGLRVHATDVADGMVSAIDQKIRRAQAGTCFTAQQLSFTDLHNVQGAPFDLIFSNFGGLNCIADLKDVTRFLPSLLKPNGRVVWVVMPPVCPWELTQALRGRFDVARRRLHSNGVLANVEGAQVWTWYHTSRSVRSAFDSRFRLVNQRAISLFSPPSYMDRFPLLCPRLTNFLFELDGHLGGLPPFNQWGDFVMYTFKYESAS